MKKAISPISIFRVTALTFAVLLLFGCINGATKAYKKGVAKLQQGEYNYATEYFKTSLAKGGNRARLNYLIAENYRLTNRIDEAKKHYENAIKAGIREDRAVYYYAQSLKATGNYYDARLMFEKYAKVGANKTLASNSLKEADYLASLNLLRATQQRYQITNMGTDINTEGPEYAPLLRNGDLIYTSSNNQFQYTAIGSGFTDIYSFKFDGSGPFTGFKRSFGEKINRNKTHEACATLSPDGNTIIFVRSNDGKRKGAVDTDLYFTELRDEIWTEPQIITSLSDARAWESTPMLAPDGKTMYFASNKKGGFGGIDLYKSIWSDSAGWLAPINLGPAINTSGNEMFPCFGLDSTFYFASDGQPGLGRLDLFKLGSDSTGKPIAINLGQGINTASDDFGISFKDDSSGFFASNRPGGKGDDDIYAFRMLPPLPIPIVKKTVSKLTLFVTTQQLDKIDTLKQPLEYANVQIRNEASLVTDSATTNTDGMASFDVDSSYKGYIYADKKGYFATTLFYNIKDSVYRIDTSTSSDMIIKYYAARLHLQKIQRGREIVLEHIYYDYNKADIRFDAEPDLMLVVDFLRKNPNVYIELGAHTDSRGNDEYNLKLSKLRAQAAVSFIIQQGIDADRVKPVGYGETRHIIPNAQTEEEHQINRRTEFKIIEVRN